MLSVSEHKIFRSRVNRMVLCTIAFLFPHLAESEAVKFTGILIDTVVHMNISDRHSECLTHWNRQAIRESIGFQNFSEQPDYGQK
jgi:hypothetical protein